MKILWFLKQLSQEGLTLCMFQPIPSRWVIFLNNKYRQNCEWFISVFNELIVKFYGVFLWNFRVYFDPQQCCIRIYLSIHLPTLLTVCLLYTDYSRTIHFNQHWIHTFCVLTTLTISIHWIYTFCIQTTLIISIHWMYTFCIPTTLAINIHLPYRRLIFLHSPSRQACPQAAVQTTNRRLWELCKGAF